MRRLFTLSLGLALSLALAPGATAEPPTFDEALETAWRDLEQLEDLLDDPKALNKDITTYLRVVLEDARKLDLPKRAEGTDPGAIGTEAKRRHRVWERSLEKFRDETVDLLLEALTESDLDAHGRNARAPVNAAAASLLPKAPVFVTDAGDRKRLSKRIIRKIKRMERARHDIDADVFEGAFTALATLGLPGNLDWLMENYLHARKQPEEVARLRAALRSMRKFETMEPRSRHALVDQMLKRYVAMEDLASQSTTEVSALAAKRFWDAIRTDALPLIQYATGYPRHPGGTALASMREFWQWFREHDDPRDPVWSRELAAETPG